MTTFRAPVEIRAPFEDCLYLDHYGRVWPYPLNELCPVCGQPDSCGDCNHAPLSRRDAEVILLGDGDARISGDDPRSDFVAWSGGFEPESEECIQRYLDAQFGTPGSTFYENRLAFESDRAKVHAALLDGLIARLSQQDADEKGWTDDVRPGDRLFQIESD